MTKLKLDIKRLDDYTLAVKVLEQDESLRCANASDGKKQYSKEVNIL